MAAVAAAGSGSNPPPHDNRGGGRKRPPDDRIVPFNDEEEFLRKTAERVARMSKRIREMNVGELRYRFVRRHLCVDKNFNPIPIGHEHIRFEGRFGEVVHTIEPDVCVLDEHGQLTEFGRNYLTHWFLTSSADIESKREPIFGEKETNTVILNETYESLCELMYRSMKIEKRSGCMYLTGRPLFIATLHKEIVATTFDRDKKKLYTPPRGERWVFQNPIDNSPYEEALKNKKLAQPILSISNPPVNEIRGIDGRCNEYRYEIWVSHRHLVISVFDSSLRFPDHLEGACDFDHSPYEMSLFNDFDAEYLENVRRLMERTKITPNPRFVEVFEPTGLHRCSAPWRLTPPRVFKEKENCKFNLDKLKTANDDHRKLGQMSWLTESFRRKLVLPPLNDEDNADFLEFKALREGQRESPNEQPTKKFKIMDFSENERLAVLRAILILKLKLEYTMFYAPAMVTLVRSQRRSEPREVGASVPIPRNRRAGSWPLKNEEEKKSLGSKLESCKTKDDEKE